MSDKPSSPARISGAYMSAHWTRWLAFGFGSGLVPRAPGTAGTVFAWLSYLAMAEVLNHSALLVVILWSMVLGVWICEQTVRALGVHDHPAIVWDEIAAFWAVLWWAGSDWLTATVAFVLFRFFDAVKPAPIGWLDKNIKGGIGVMVDDLAAALATVLCLWAYQRVI